MYLQVDLKSLDMIPNNILNCNNYFHFKFKLKPGSTIIYKKLKENEFEK